MKQVVVIGGGASGLLAAVTAAGQGAQVILLEKMPSVGKKILITGKGRCNLTNECDMETLIKNIPGNGTFLYSAFHTFTKEDIRNFMEKYGVQTKVERGNRVFPVSDKASDVVAAFVRALKEYKVEVYNNSKVTKILTKDNKITGVVSETNLYKADAVILATGGASYPGTGSTGDGYEIAKQLGHNVVSIKPSLVPLEVEEEWIKDLQGLSLKNVEASVMANGTKVESEFGEMLITHFGLSGPIILSLSRTVSKLLQQKDKPEIVVEVNLKPALEEQVLDKRIQRDFTKFQRKILKNSLQELLPMRLIDIVMDLAFLDPEKPVNQITKAERIRLIKILQHMPFSIANTRSVSEAIVTAGGVSVKEINPKTMQSKLIEGLYFAGEVIDIDGFTGGFNLQAAFSSGYVAGFHAGQV